MSDKLRGLPSKQEVLWCLIPPISHRFERRRAVERAVDLRSPKLGRVPGQPFLLRHFLWIERTAPAVIGPSRGADKAVAHGISDRLGVFLNMPDNGG
jgi:hypothetical protein